MISAYIHYITSNRGLSSNTARAYGQALRAFAAAHPSQRWSTITAADVNTYVAKLHDSHMGANSIGVAVSALRSFYRYLGHFYGLTANPTAFIAVPKRTELVAKSVSMAEVDVVLQSCTNPALTAGIALMAWCGLRVSEVRSLSWSDITDTRVLVHGKGNKERYVYLHGSLVPMLEALPRTSTYILGATQDRPFREAVFNEFRRHGIYCTSHMLRHAFASYCVNRGMPLSTLRQLLGHQDIRTTQRYLHADNSTVAAQLASVF